MEYSFISNVNILAAMTEIFWGKVFGLAIPALLIPPVCAYVSVGMLNPRLLPLLASGDVLWAWLTIAERKRKLISPWKKPKQYLEPTLNS